MVRAGKNISYVGAAVNFYLLSRLRNPLTCPPNQYKIGVYENAKVDHDNRIGGAMLLLDIELGDDRDPMGGGVLAI